MWRGLHFSLRERSLQTKVRATCSEALNISAFMGPTVNNCGPKFFRFFCLRIGRGYGSLRESYSAKRCSSQGSAWFE
jgi:hypothetical protein